MRDFARAVWPLLDQRLRRRLAGSAVAATLIAALEALALLLLLPILEVLTAPGDAPRSAIVERSGRLLGIADDLRLAAVLGGVAVVAFIAKGCLSLLYLRWNIGLLLDAGAELSSRLLRSYLGAPYRFHLQRSSAHLQSTIHDSVRRTFGEALVGVVGAVADVVVLAAVAVVLVLAEPAVAVGTALYFALVGVGYQRLIHGRAREAGAELLQQNGLEYQLIQQGLHAVKDIQIGHHEDFFASSLRTTMLGSARNVRTLLVLHQTPRYYLEVSLIVGVGVLSAVLFSVRPVAEATATLGLFLAAGFRLLPSLNRVLVASSSMRSGLPAVEEIATDLAALDLGERRRVEHESPIGLEQPVELRFDAVSFGYDDGEPVLRDLSLVIPARRSVAFVGPSGAGKTTLIDLLLGLLDPVSGRLLLDGEPLDRHRASWQRSLGYVPQDTSILNDTIRANVAFGRARDEIDDDLVHRALHDAQLTELVASLPAGLDTPLLERGVRLSGGQRQRIGIARALYRRPSVLVLDEATSSLDVATESLITDTLDRLGDDLTTITVTHRLSTVRRCEEIHVLDRGRLIASGTYDELAATCPLFADLARLSAERPSGALAAPER